VSTAASTIVVRAGLRLFQESEDRRRRFTAMLGAVREEADREGVQDLNSVLGEMDGIIDKSAG